MAFVGNVGSGPRSDSQSALAALFTAVALGFLSGCGGGGSNTIAPSGRSDVASQGRQPPQVRPSPFRWATPRRIRCRPSRASGSTVAFGTPSTSVTGTMTATMTTTAPPGAATQSALRTTQSGTLTFYVYETFTPSVSVTFASLPAISVTLPSSIPTTGQQFFYAFSNGGTSLPPDFQD